MRSEEGCDSNSGFWFSHNSLAEVLLGRITLNESGQNITKMVVIGMTTAFVV